jgi:hypothetical protein
MIEMSEEMKLVKPSIEYLDPDPVSLPLRS